MPRIQVKINGASVYDRFADISTEFPDAEFRILATIPTDDELLEIVEITTSNGDTLVHHFEDAPEVRSYEVVHNDSQSLLIQFIIPVSETYDALRRAKTIPQYPVILQDGWFSKTLTAPHERLSEYTAELAAAGIPYEIVSLTQSYDPSELLTDRQWEFITEAVERGYYDTPRGCTLTELAETLDINRSAASRLHHRAERRIITEFVAEAAP
jgi:predicted DNA binding protein